MVPVSTAPVPAYPSFDPSGEPSESTAGGAQSGEPTPSPSPDSVQRAFAPDNGKGATDPQPMNADGTTLSGCSPASTTALEDGIWYGVVKKWGDDSISFDLACLYHQDSPEAAALREAQEKYFAGDGSDEFPDAYPTSNDNPGVRVLPLATDARFWVANEASDPDAVNPPYSQVREEWGASDYYVYVNGGEVTDVEGVYYP